MNASIGQFFGSAKSHRPGFRTPVWLSPAQKVRSFHGTIQIYVRSGEFHHKGEAWGQDHPSEICLPYRALRFLNASLPLIALGVFSMSGLP